MDRIRRFLNLAFLILLIVLIGNNLRAGLFSHDILIFNNSLTELLQSLAVMALALLIFWPGPLQRESHAAPGSPQKLSLGWRTFFITIGLCVITVVLVNPRGLYGVRIFPQLANGLKQDKIQYYQALGAEPDLVILGSSRSLSISPAYIQETLGIHAYNFGFSGVSPTELMLQAELIFSDHKPVTPRVILFEISPSNIQQHEDDELTEVPIEFLPIMPAKTAAGFLSERYLELFNIHQFIESVYVLQFVQEQRTPQNYWKVMPDGFSLFFPPDTLSDALDRQLEQRLDIQPCQNFSQDGDDFIHHYVSLANQKNFSIIFYTSPIQPYFRQEYLDKTPIYRHCNQYLVDLMDTIVAENPSIFFVDLSDPVTTDIHIDDRGFYDGFHLTPASSEKLIDFLAPTIQEALRISSEQRHQP